METNDEMKTNTLGVVSDVVDVEESIFFQKMNFPIKNFQFSSVL